MYQRSKIPEILIDRDWTPKEIDNLSTKLNIPKEAVKNVLDFHFKGVSDALWNGKTNIEVTDLIRFQLKPSPVKKELDITLAKAENIKTRFKLHPEKLKQGLKKNQIKIDYLTTKLENFKKLGNGI